MSCSFSKLNEHSNLPSVPFNLTTFENVSAPPVPSLLRGYSAPVRLSGLSAERLRFLAAHDSDPFVRWDSLQQYATGVMLGMIAAPGGAMTLDAGLSEAFAATLAGAEADSAFAAEALMLPGEAFIGDQMAAVDVDAIHAARRFLRAALGRAHAAALLATYDRLADAGPYSIDGAAMGRRWGGDGAAAGRRWGGDGGERERARIAVL